MDRLVATLPTHFKAETEPMIHGQAVEVPTRLKNMHAIRMMSGAVFTHEILSFTKK